jgi:hypothetical protein
MLSAILSCIPAATVAWFLHLPVIGAVLAALTSMATTLGSSVIARSISAKLGPLAMGLGMDFGVHISANVLAFGTPLGLFAGFFIPCYQRVSTHLSDVWMRWHHGGPITYLIGYLITKMPRRTIQREIHYELNVNDLEVVPSARSTLSTAVDSNAAFGDDPSVSAATTHQVLQLNHSLDATFASENRLDANAQRLTDQKLSSAHERYSSNYQDGFRQFQPSME